MNKYQRIVLQLTALLVLIACLFPPYSFRTDTGEVYNRGFDFLFSEHGAHFGTIDVLSFCSELLGITLIGVLVYFSLRKLSK